MGVQKVHIFNLVGYEWPLLQLLWQNTRYICATAATSSLIGYGLAILDFGKNKYNVSTQARLHVAICLMNERVFMR